VGCTSRLLGRTVIPHQATILSQGLATHSRGCPRVLHVDFLGTQVPLNGAVDDAQRSVLAATDPGSKLPKGNRHSCAHTPPEVTTEEAFRVNAPSRHRLDTLVELPDALHDALLALGLLLLGEGLLVLCLLCQI
jgi:hypothetical protein